MATSSYDAALARLLAHEGGYSNHPSDPGGPTNFGITIGDYRKYVKRDATAADVKAMRVAEAKAIYRARYWDALRCDGLPAGVDYAVFDYGVNSGIGRSTKVLRRLLGFADAGKVSDEVVAAAGAANAPNLVAAICDERLRFLKSLKTWPVFGNGWAQRVAEVRVVGVALASAPPAAPPPTAPPIVPLQPDQPAARGLFHALIAALLAVFRRPSHGR
jgi:lysozyme family protein